MWLKNDRGIARTLYESNKDNIIIHMQSHTLYYFNYTKCLWQTSDCRDNTCLYNLFGKFINMDLKTVMDNKRFKNYLSKLKIVKISLDKASKMAVILKIAKRH